MKQSIIRYMTEVLELPQEDTQELYDYYLDTLKDHCERMTQAITAVDFGEIRNLTHSLTGCSGNVGAQEIVAIVHQINAAAKALDIQQVQVEFDKLQTISNTLSAER